jgi:hypothetical protein
VADLSVVEGDELISRARAILIKLDDRLRAVGPIMKEIGHLRAEVGLIYVELERRGVDVKELCLL